MKRVAWWWLTITLVIGPLPVGSTVGFPDRFYFTVNNLTGRVLHKVESSHQKVQIWKDFPHTIEHGLNDKIMQGRVETMLADDWEAFAVYAYTYDDAYDASCPASTCWEGCAVLIKRNRMFCQHLSKDGRWSKPDRQTCGALGPMPSTHVCDVQVKRLDTLGHDYEHRLTVQSHQRSAWQFLQGQASIVQIGPKVPQMQSVPMPITRGYEHSATD